MKNRKISSAPMPTVRRMPSYLRVLRELSGGGLRHVSSAHIAGELGLESIQVRKDLAVTGLTGQPGLGYDIEALIDAIRAFLGWENATDAFLVGVGHLGAALAGYDGFSVYGLNIVALFDIDPRKIGSTVHGRSVFHVDRFPDLSRRMHVHLGIMTVDSGAAQLTADLMVSAGIRAIWNFTPVKLKVPEHVVVERVDLAASLAVLSNKLADTMKHDFRGQES